jgi:hypothetical protein
MDDKKLNNYDADYPYKKSKITVDMSNKGYPIIEMTNNALLFPEGPKNEVDITEFKQQEP